MNGEASTDIHTPPSVKHTASGDLQCSRSSARCSVMTESVGGAEAGGRPQREGIYAYIWLIHDVVRQKPMQHCKAIIFQFFVKKNMFINLVYG